MNVDVGQFVPIVPGTKWDLSVWNLRFYIFRKVSWVIPFTISFPPSHPTPTPAFCLSKFFLFSCCTFWTSSLIFLAFNSQVPSSHFFVLLLGVFPWVYLANVLFNFKNFSASKFFVFLGVSYSVIHFYHKTFFSHLCNIFTCLPKDIKIYSKKYFLLPITVSIASELPLFVLFLFSYVRDCSVL